MADIAMLVAEEYERRVKASRTSGGGNREEIDMLFPCVSVLARGLDGIKNKFGEQKVDDQLLKLNLVPKSQIGSAAINGFFSA